MTSTAMSTDITIDAAMRRQIIDWLQGSFDGTIIDPGHQDYPTARRVWNGMIDKHPGLILRCTSTTDVVAAVGAAREFGLAPAVRCGGHNVAGKAMSEGGLTIDLAGLRQVTVDAGRHLVRACGGCLLGDVDAATSAHNMIVLAGIMSETGVGGLALGGGIGEFSQARADLRPVRRAGGCPGKRRGSRRPRPSIPTCSGRCAAAAATSAWSPGSRSGATTSVR